MLNFNLRPSKIKYKNTEMNTESAPIRFKRGEVRIPCEKYPEENIVKICTTDKENPRPMCLECIMENPDYVKNHKKNIISVE